MFAVSLASPKNLSNRKERSQILKNLNEQTSNFNANYDTTFERPFSTTDALAQKYGATYTSFAQSDTLEYRYSFRKDTDKTSVNYFADGKDQEDDDQVKT